MGIFTNTVDSIVADFHKTLGKLERLIAREEARQERLGDDILDLEAQIEAKDDEMVEAGMVINRARRISGKIKELVE